MRPTWDEYFLELAYLAATRATCSRKHVGAVIVTPERRVVATGYNGAPANMPSCDEVDHEMVDGHCVRSLHAESNAIDFAGRFAQGCTLYTTVTPCYDCAKRIVNAGIYRVVYDEHYESRYNKSSTVQEFLRAGGIEVVQLEIPGVRLFKEKLAEVQAARLEMARNTIVEYQCGCKTTGDKAPQRCGEHNTARAHD